MPASIERLQPRAVVSPLEQLDARAGARPSSTRASGHRDGRPPTRRAARRGSHASRALLANHDEALRLTGETDPEAAALALAESVETAVVTAAPTGAVAAADGELVAVAAPAVEVRDTTGAGDLFTAAYVWGDLAGLPLEERLRRAASTPPSRCGRPPGPRSAATRDELERALAELDPAIVHE